MGMNVVVDHDVVYFKVVELKLGDQPRGKTKPKFDSMGMSAQEYTNFRDSLYFGLSDLRTALNTDYFDHGLVLPYNIQELKSSLVFTSQAMFILMELEDGFDRIFEDDLWN